MGTTKGVQKIDPQALQRLKQNWENKCRKLPIKADTQIIDVIKLNTPSISVVNIGEQSTQNGKKVFGSAIVSIAEYFGSEWSERQCIDLSVMLFSEYHYWTFGELKHFVMKVKKGEYGKIYGKLLPVDVMMYAEEYNNELLIARAQYKPMVVDQPEEEPKYVSTDQIRKAFSSFADEWRQEQAKDRSARNEQKKQQRKEDEEKLLRDYCKAHNLNYEIVKQDFLNKIRNA